MQHETGDNFQELKALQELNAKVRFLTKKVVKLEKMILELKEEKAFEADFKLFETFIDEEEKAREFENTRYEFDDFMW